MQFPAVAAPAAPAVGPKIGAVIMFATVLASAVVLGSVLAVAVFLLAF